MVSITSNPVIAFIALTALIIFLTYLFVFIYPLNKLQWKKTDFIWLSLTSIGLYGLVVKNQGKILKAELNYGEAYMTNLGEQVQDMVGQLWYCKPAFAKTEFSPSNLEQIQLEYDQSCKWSNETSDIVDSLIGNHQLISDSILPKFQITDVVLVENISILKKNIYQYNQELKNRLEKEHMISNWLNNLMEWFAPVFFIVGLSLRFAKAVGEIRLEKRERKIH